jgi:2'-5' RNA ligase
MVSTVQSRHRQTTALTAAIAGVATMNEASARLRLFVAAPVPEPVKDAIARAQAELKNTLNTREIRWTAPAQWHLTLKFLGPVAPDRVEPLQEAVRKASAAVVSFRVAAQRLGFFPNARFPRVLWAGVDDPDGRLTALQAAIESACREFTSEQPEQRFTGHVTIGRIKTLNRSQTNALAGAVSGMAERAFGAWTCDRVEIIRSELPGNTGAPAGGTRALPGGPKYTVLSVIPLNPKS